MKRYNYAKKTIKDKELAEYVTNFRNRAKLAKSSEALQEAMESVVLDSNAVDEKGKADVAPTKEHGKRIRSEDSVEGDSTKKVKSDLEEYIVFVVNEAVKGGRVVPELWQLVETNPTDLFLEVLEQEHPTVDIQFYGAGNEDQDTNTSSARTRRRSNGLRQASLL